MRDTLCRGSRPLLATSLIILFAAALGHGQTQDPAVALLTQADGQINAGDYSGAIASLRKLTTDYPSTASGMVGKVNLGFALYLNKEYEEAVAVLKPMPDDKAMPPTSREFASLYLAQALAGQASSKEGSAQESGYQAAAEAYGRFLKDYPKSDSREDGLYGRGLAFLFLKKYDDAVKDLLAARSDFPMSAAKLDVLYLLGLAYAQKAQALVAEGKVEESKEPVGKARETFEQIIKEGGERPGLANDTYFQIGEVMLNTDNYDAAIEYYRKVRPRDQLVAQMERGIQRLLEQIRANPSKLRELRQQKLREEALLAGLKEKPDPLVSALAKVGFCFIQKGGYNEARALGNHAARFATGDQEKFILYQRVLAFALQKLVDPAQAAFDAWREKYGKDPLGENIGLVLGGLYVDAGKPEAAIREFQRSLDDYPKGKFAEEIVMNVGRALAQTGKFAEARQRFDDYIKKKGNTAEGEVAKLSLGQVLVEMKQFDEALKLLRDLAGNAKEADIKKQAAFRVGVALESAGRREEALAAHEAFAKEYGKDALAGTALFQAGRLREQLGKGEEALATYARVVAEYPKEQVAPFAQQAIAMHHLQAQPSRVPEALEAFGKLREMFPESDLAPAALFYEAAVFSQTGDPDKAAEKYEEVIKAYPREKVAPDARGQIAKLWSDRVRAMGTPAALGEDDRKKWDELMRRALAAVEKLLAEYPDSAPVSDALSTAAELQALMVRYGKQQRADSEKYFAGLAEKFGADPAVKVRLQFAQASIPFDAGDFAAAAAVMKAAYDAAPEARYSRQDMNRFGTALIKTGDAAKALEVFQRLMKDFDKDPFAQADGVFGIAVAQQALGKKAESDAMFARLFKEYPWSPKVPEAKLNTAKAIEGAKPDDAIAMYRDVISAREAPASIKAQAMEGAGRLAEKKGDFEGAGKYFEMIEAFLGPTAGEKSPEGLAKAGELYEKAGKPVLARRSYETLVAAYPQSPLKAKAEERLRALPPQGAAARK